MVDKRYEISPQAYGAIGELFRRIRKDFENSEVEAAFQKWKAEKDARVAQGLPADDSLQNIGGNNNVVFQDDGTVVVYRNAQEIGAVGR